MSFIISIEIKKWRLLCHTIYEIIIDKLITVDKFASSFNLFSVPPYYNRSGSVFAAMYFWHVKTSRTVYLPHVHPLSVESGRERARSAAKSIHAILFSFAHVFIVARRINEPRPLVIYDKQMYPARVHLAGRDDPILRVAFRRASTPTW